MTEQEYRGELVKECEGCKYWHRGVEVHHNHCDSGWHRDDYANGRGQGHSINTKTGKFWCHYAVLMVYDLEREGAE